MSSLVPRAPGIVEHGRRSVGQPQRTEVALAHGHRGHPERLVGLLDGPGGLPGGEPERPVPAVVARHHHRPAGRHAELVADQLGRLRVVLFALARHSEAAVAVRLERRPVEGVGPALGGHHHRGRPAVARRGGVGLHPELLDRIQHPLHRGVVAPPPVDRGRPVQHKLHRAFRSPERPHVLDLRHQRQQHLQVAPADGKLLHPCALQHVPDRRAVRGHHGRDVVDLHNRGGAARLEQRIDHQVLLHLQGERPFVLVHPRDFDRNPVPPGRKARKIVAAGVTGPGRGNDSRRRVGDDHRRVRDDGSRLILYGSGYGSGARLRPGAGRGQQKRGCQDNRQLHDFYSPFLARHGFPPSRRTSFRAVWTGYDKLTVAVALNVRNGSERDVRNVV